MSGQKRKSALLGLIVLGGLVAVGVAAANRPKRRGSVEVSIDEGEYLTDQQFFDIYGYWPNEADRVNEKGEYIEFENV